MKERNDLAAALIGIPLAIGIALAGWFVGHALFGARATERYVTVKGLAEREVGADLALWAGPEEESLEACARLRGAAARLCLSPPGPMLGPGDGS